MCSSDDAARVDYHPSAAVSRHVRRRHRHGVTRLRRELQNMQLLDKSAPSLWSGILGEAERKTRTGVSSVG
jgi:hypothetical protein